MNFECSPPSWDEIEGDSIFDNPQAFIKDLINGGEVVISNGFAPGESGPFEVPIGGYLKRLLIDSGVRAARLVEETGIDKALMSKMLNGIRRPSCYSLRTIADALVSLGITLPSLDFVYGIVRDSKGRISIEEMLLIVKRWTHFVLLLRGGWIRIASMYNCMYSVGVYQVGALVAAGYVDFFPEREE